jgi:hypothetical protein
MLFNIGLIGWDFAFNHADLFQLMFSLERPTPSEEMVHFFSLTESIFMELSKNNKVISQSLLLSLICLNHGAISILMQSPPVPPHFIKKDPRELYISIIQRFISNI